MHYRPFGKTGWDVSAVGFGGWAIGGGWGPQEDDQSLKALHRALDLGVNLIDTAAGYGKGHGERLIAHLVVVVVDGHLHGLQALKERGGNGVRVATKFGPRGGPWPPSPYCRWEDRYPEAHLRKKVEERLQNLQTDCVDLLQLHTWTRAWNNDPQPLLILRKLQEEGKVRHIGISTPEHDQNCAVDLIRSGVVDSVQVIFNIFEQEPAAQLLPEAQKHGVAIIARVAFDEGVRRSSPNARASRHWRQSTPN